MYAENSKLYAVWKKEIVYLTFIGFYDCAGNSYVMNNQELLPDGDDRVKHAYYYNNTGKDVAVTITVKAKKIVTDAQYYGVYASTGNALYTYTGNILAFAPTSYSDYITQTVSATIPNGYYLTLFVNNGSYTIWTIEVK